MNFLNIAEAKEIYKQGKNITQYLRKKFNESANTSEIIEIAYDIQAGSYIENVTAHRLKAEAYAYELGGILKQHLQKDDSLLDVGTGELTTLSLVLNNIDVELSKVLAFDISWSRLSKGMTFYRENNKKADITVEAFVADIKKIPLHGKCVDVVTSSHALEPNGKNLAVLLTELFRIAKRKLVLFEPSYELNSKEGKERMDSLGYIKNIKGEVEKLRGKVTDIIPIQNIANPLNPTTCYIIEPPKSSSVFVDMPIYCVPGTDFKLNSNGLFLSSENTGLVFPVLDEIPILRNSSAILATAKF